jgi:lysophospholipid acyltransferase (LPLAT)-like uncharacterized protein
LLGWLIATIIRGVGLTLRFRLDDRSGVCKSPPEGAMVWVFWHNRVFTAPLVYKKYLRKRRGSVLTSPSGDGEIIAQVMARFGVGAVRGSSNKRPAAALRELVKTIRGGGDVGITPDGPRGPVYEMQGGVVKLAQLAAVPVLPIRMVYSRAITLKTWDRFQIPLPFSRVDVVFEELQSLPRVGTEEASEAQRLSLQQVLKGES